MSKPNILTAGQLIEILSKLKPDEKVRFRSNEECHQNNFVATNVEIVDEYVVLHGWMESVIYYQKNEYQQWITTSVVRDIREGGEVINAIKEELGI